jgi:membrane associated rhomboid family serine protease
MNRNSGGGQMSLPMTPMVKKLLIINVVLWIVGQLIIEGMLHIRFTSILALIPETTIFRGFLWQPFTYMFLHALDVSHILFNMMMLWFLGAELEAKWGSRFFVIFYIVCGAGAGVLYALGTWVFSAITGNPQAMLVPVIGASGAIFGLMMAYGMLFGERIMLFMMIFPMKAKYVVMLLAGIELINLITAGIAGGEVAYLAHLGGIVVGYTFLKLNELNFRRQSSKKRGRSLRLVVDNEKSPEKKTPKYWN